MARINLKCDDCNHKFGLMYFFIRPEKIKCPVCGSPRVREEISGTGNCGCGGNQDRPFRFT